MAVVAPKGAVGAVPNELEPKAAAPKGLAAAVEGAAGAAAGVASNSNKRSLGFDAAVATGSIDAEMLENDQFTRSAQEQNMIIDKYIRLRQRWIKLLFAIFRAILVLQRAKKEK